MDTAAEHVLAMAYISRHRLDFKWKRLDGVDHCVVGYVLDRPKKTVVGVGYSLYKAVLDYQKKSGVEWGS